MNLDKIEKRVAELRNDTINAVPVEIDWRERLGEDCEGWQSYDTCECSECGKLVVGSWGEQSHCDAEDESNCEGYLNFSEPMMSYYYPLPHADLKPEDAKKIDGPLVLVQFEDGSWALALSGGGMDLSWEICKAHIDLGYLPPIHFSALPEMADKKWNEETALVILAMQRSLAIASGWITRKLERLIDLEVGLKFPKEEE